MTPLVFTSDIDVELVDHMGTDARIVQAARVSTQGSAAEESESAGLLAYLMKNRHGSPFEHITFTWRVTAPIFVWREHMRHRIASYNEESSRYKQLDARFYIPPADRNLVQTGKPGHYAFGPGTEAQWDAVLNATRDAALLAYALYSQMLNEGIAREVARNVLPVCTFSTAFVTMNARGLMNFLSLRTKSPDSTFPSFPLREIEMVAEQYEADFARVAPLTHQAFCDAGRVAP